MFSVDDNTNLTTDRELLSRFQAKEKSSRKKMNRKKRINLPPAKTISNMKERPCQEVIVRHLYCLSRPSISWHFTSVDSNSFMPQSTGRIYHLTSHLFSCRLEKFQNYDYPLLKIFFSCFITLMPYFNECKIAENKTTRNHLRNPYSHAANYFGPAQINATAVMLRSDTGKVLHDPCSIYRDIVIL